MQYIKHIIICSMLLMFSTTALGQSETLNFTLESNSVELDGDNIALESNLVKTGDQFVWSQENSGNAISTTYVITNKVENWNTETSTGSIEYTLENNGYQSTLTINGTSNGVSAILSSVTSNGQTENLVFNISTTTYN